MTLGDFLLLFPDSLCNGAWSVSLVTGPPSLCCNSAMTSLDLVLLHLEAISQDMEFISLCSDPASRFEARQGMLGSFFLLDLFELV
ncbi:hypothetical protein MtrunA17_Chr8g0386381 [Medicago truncatula]|uniref:Uncharacterized protein n=1 Tax=Medicago truncatula TaxID=3880 RepID=A0A396GXE6_MEDTR|nr:hypothetical protein MtrunA17_Chr8g0386381 [Medicago truncatula]